jgi:SAM-dependent methyltransferase
MGLLDRALYKVRDIRSRALFAVLDRHVRGDVIDVGGGRFVTTVEERGLPFRSWTIVEPTPALLPGLSSARVHEVVGDGQHLGMRDGSYDAALSIQVLEHVFEPMRMLEELYRVVRPGGVVIVMVPQTANIHLAPHHYQNFTRYWLDEGARRLGAEVVERHTMGGAWSSIASRLVMQYPATFGVAGFRHEGARRTPLFWALLPVGLVVSAVMVPVTMLLGLADLEEEPNNHLMVLRKPD